MSYLITQEKLKKQEQERNERIAEENKTTVSERQIEADIILSKLRPHRLAIKDIPSDGHCMYHAVADQMKQQSMAFSSDVCTKLTTLRSNCIPRTLADTGTLFYMEQEPAFKYLRRLTGTYMRARPDDYLPFLALDEDSDKSSQGTTCML